SDTLSSGAPDSALDEQIAFDPALFAFSSEEEQSSSDEASAKDQQPTSNDAAPDDLHPTTDAISANDQQPPTNDAFRIAGGAATPADILKFLIDRTGYIKSLEEEDTPESMSRIENLKELVNAALDSRDRGETLDEFLDHAALV